MKKLISVIIACLALFVAHCAGAAPAIQAFQPDSLERIVANQKGKPFVLFVWSLDCAYCKASLDALGQEKRKRKSFNVVTLATDPLDDTQAATLMKKKLAASGLLNNAWAFGPAAPEQLRYAIDAAWHGEMPRSYWYNARGERVAHSGAITAATIAKLLAD